MSFKKKLLLFLAFACLAAQMETQAILPVPNASNQSFYEKYKTPIQLTVAGIILCIAIKAIISNKRNNPTATYQKIAPVAPKNTFHKNFISNKPETPRTTPDEFVRNYSLPVLYKDTHRPIYQIRSETNLNGWTCGFFTLKNAKDLECLMGISKPCNIYQECTNYIRNNGINPHGGITDSQLIRLADNAVHLNNFNTIILDNKNRIKLRYNWPTTYTYRIQPSHSIRQITPNVTATRNNISVWVQAPVHTNEHQIKSAVGNAIDSELHNQLLNLRKSFNQQSRAILNFGCMLNPHEEHVFLVSVIQLDGNNKALLIYDNLNKVYINSASRNAFVNALYDIFCAQ